MAAILTITKFTKSEVVASSAKPEDSSLSHQPHDNIRMKPNKLRKIDYKRQLQQQQQQPSILEIERAIGAGVFRDRDVNRQASKHKFIIFPL